MKAVLTEWEVIKTSGDFDKYIDTLIKYCPNFYKRDFTLIMQSFLNLEELVAQPDAYHRHGVISAHFMQRLIENFPVYNLSDEEKFEMLAAALIHDCEIDELNEKVAKYSFVHCNKKAFDYLFRNTGLEIETITRIIELVNTTIYDDNNNWLEYNDLQRTFLLGRRTQKLIVHHPALTKKRYKILAIILADIVGQLAAAGNRKIANKYLFKNNPSLDQSIPEAFLSLYSIMGGYWDTKNVITSEEKKLFMSYAKARENVEGGKEFGD